MRLLSCEIAGFGRISKLNIDFKRGLNAYLENNGWGKTTFSVFLKAMFFGMEYSRKRMLSEREHYRPWDGGSYGGSLTFASDGREYRIERTFGKKDTEDTFALYDAKTGLLSEDFSPEIGQELFQVDRDSFEKSIFIPQNSLATGMTDSLNAKMGDMVSAQDDINNFDAAIRRLEEAKRVYTKNSKLDPGKLLAVRQEIRSCRESLEHLPVLADALEKQQGVLEEKRAQLHQKKAAKEALQTQIAAQSKREQELGVYREKKDSFEKLKNDFVNIEAFFAAGLPERDMLNEMDERERHLEVDAKQLEAVRSELLSQEEAEKLNRLFENSDIKEEILDEWDGKAERLLALRLKSEHSKMSDEEKEHLTELTAYFAKRNPTAEELETALLDASELAQLEGQVEALDEQYRNMRAKAAAEADRGREGGSPRGVLYCIVGVAALLAGAAVFVFGLGGSIGSLLALFCAVAALAVTVLMIVNVQRNRREEAEKSAALADNLAQVSSALDSKRNERDRQKEQCKAFLSGFLVSPADTYTQMIGEIQRKKEAYTRLAAQEQKVLEEASGTLEELSGLQIELYTAMMPFAEIYGMDLYEDHNEEELIKNLKEDIKKYDKLCSDQKEQEALETVIRKEQGILSDFLRQFPVEREGEKEQLLEIRQKADRYRTLREQMKELRLELEEFEKHHSIDEETRSVVALQEEEAAIDAEIADLNSQLIKAQEMENDLSDQIEELEETGDRLEPLEETERDYRRKVQLYESTMDYLTRAKELFLARYIGPLRESMLYYLSLIGADAAKTAPDATDFSLDMDLGIRLSYNGSLKESAYLSSGYQDLVAVCARLALVDVLYRKEEPFLILDDPFANLDEAKTARAMELLEKLSRTRQIIYYTCHGSRMPRQTTNFATG